MKTDVIEINAKKLSGTPVFRGTRVPVETLFDHLEEGISIDTFLSDFPSVRREQVNEVLEIASKLLSSKELRKLYESGA
jgi:uncharacterized protein (DUF433 family)